MNESQSLKKNKEIGARSFLWIGLTGGVATGKSTVSGLLQDQGLAVIDADVLAHEALQPGTESYEQIVRTFGQGVLNPDGSIQRSALASQIFSNEQKKLQLEGITHPYVQKRVQELKESFRQQGHQIVIYDVPLLFEKNLQSQFDFVIVVTCSEALQIQRMKSRNRWSDEEIRQRLANQMPMFQKELQADFVIRNEGTKEELGRAVNQVRDELRQKI